LNNIIKHAEASNVNIHIAYDEKNVRINVWDNGLGFDLDEAKQRRAARPSLGLAGMEERAALLNGTVTVQSRPGYGTEVEAVIPYHKTLESDGLLSNTREQAPALQKTRGDQ
jgi:signal transduction histidine kinase